MSAIIPIVQGILVISLLVVIGYGLYKLFTGNILGDLLTALNPVKAIEAVGEAATNVGKSFGPGDHSRKPGEACATDADCDTDECVQGALKCAENWRSSDGKKTGKYLPRGTYCVMGQSQCNPESFCGGGDSTCQPRKAPGESCAINAECLYDKCVQGALKCSDKDGKLPKGSYCLAGSSQCADGLWCGGVPVECREKGGIGAYCPLSSEACRGPEPERQATPAELAKVKSVADQLRSSPFLKGAASYFDRIVSNGKIPATAGLYCAADSKCKSKNSKGSFCLTDSACYSGKCSMLKCE